MLHHLAHQCLCIRRAAGCQRCLWGWVVICILFDAQIKTHLRAQHIHVSARLLALLWHQNHSCLVLLSSSPHLPSLDLTSLISPDLTIPYQHSRQYLQAIPSMPALFTVGTLPGMLCAARHRLSDVRQRRPLSFSACLYAAVPVFLVPSDCMYACQACHSLCQCKYCDTRADVSAKNNCLDDAAASHTSKH